MGQESVNREASVEREDGGQRDQPARRRRPGRCTFWLVLAATSSGVVGIALGTVVGGAVFAVHTILAVAAVGAGARSRHARLGIVTLVVTAFAALAGLLHAWGAPRVLRGHIAIGVVAPVVAGVALAMRPRVPSPVDPARRCMLRAAPRVVGAGVVGGAVVGVGRLPVVPGHDRRFSGSRRVDGALPTVQWLNDRPPSGLATWQLRVEGRGAARVWDLDELAARPVEVTATLDCTNGWYATRRWSGMPLARLLDESGVAAGGRSILVASRTGYQRRFPRADAPHLLLATRLEGELLDRGHGHPLRLVAPGRRGYWWVKWVDRVSVSDTPWWWQPPFPLS